MKAATSHVFRPKIWAILLTLLLAAGMVTAGCWQYRRGLQKQAMQAARAQLSGSLPQALLDDVRAPPAGALRQVWAEGEYLPALGVQLDNQPQQQKPGVHAWAVLQLSNGQHLIVDRGWLPLGGAITPPPAGVQRITGNWKRLPVAGMRLGNRTKDCTTVRPVRVNYPDLAEVRCLFGESTLDGLLELSPKAPGGYLRDWANAGVNEIPPSRHYAYAAQWWLFAATLVILFIKIHLKKVACHD